MASKITEFYCNYMIEYHVSIYNCYIRKYFSSIYRYLETLFSREYACTCMGADIDQRSNLCLNVVPQVVSTLILLNMNSY